MSLFSGAGGLDLGFQKDKYEIVFAVDVDKSAVETHRKAFPKTHCIQADLVNLGVDGLVSEIDKVLVPGERIGVIGGPPCQGFSRSNSNSSADDPRNKLPALYLDIVKALKTKYTVDFLIFENVLGIEDKKHASTFSAIKETLGTLGFHKSIAEYDAFNFGVPQHRQRVIIAGFASKQACESFKPTAQIKGKQTVREAIEHLPEPSYCAHGRKVVDGFHPNHWTMQPKSPRFAHPELFKEDGRSFRRLSWDKPSPTVAYGHREIHIHPDGKRRLSVYEAMQLQGFPKNYELCGTFSAQVQQVSNAVPPPLAYALAVAVEDSLKAVH
ncbi:cytosine-specific methyltransferase [Bombiscardovia nodaiensis]|uniref:DNA (cytosine-5-)-methyltransferase n=1 Tax=Bombiscardovia nodaiensis TaxID=2932181 RepID=A0ABM8B5U5_9BIFI|nr:cytosine-specific methyltransferase [Bombiscardovia nodaiensis]